jgi:hypothetical protein
MQAVKDQVDKMRGEMCLLRGDIVEHDECMNWMVPKCRDDEDGLHYCESLKDHVREECLQGDAKACDYARQLGLDIDHQSKEVASIKEDKLAEPPASIADAPSPGGEAPVVPPPAPAAPPTSETTTETTLPETTEAASLTKQETTIQEKTTLPKEETTAAPQTTAALETTAAPKKAPLDDADEKLIPALETTHAPSHPEPSGPATPGGYQEPKPGAKLQSQGFSGKKVRHEDGQTFAGDWQNEYGNPPPPEPKPEKSFAWKAASLIVPVVIVSLTALVSILFFPPASS